MPVKKDRKLISVIGILYHPTLVFQNASTVIIGTA